MNRKELKSHAKGLMKTGNPRPIYVSIVYVLILMIFAVFSYKLVGEPISEFLDSQFGNFNINMSIGDTSNIEDAIDQQQFMLAFQENMPSPIAQLLALALSLVSGVIGAGFIIFALRTIDGSEAAYGNLFDGFAMFFRIIWLYILEGIFIFLWSLLFIIPGIIAIYRYRMAIYLLLENPDMTAMQCINESKRIMKGHKGELFVLDLSFIGWFVLVAVANAISSELGIVLFGTISLGYLVRIWLLPFTTISWALFYRQRVAESAPEEDINLDELF